MASLTSNTDESTLPAGFEVPSTTNQTDDRPESETDRIDPQPGVADEPSTEAASVGSSVQGAPPAAASYVFYTSGGGLYAFPLIPGSANFTPKQIPGASAKNSPSAIIYGTNLYVLYQGGKDNLLHYIVNDGQNWGPEGIVKGPSLDGSSSPTAVLYDDKLLVLYLTDKGQLGHILLSSDGWGAASTINNVGIKWSPDATQFKQETYVFHRGGGDDNGLWCYLDPGFGNGTDYSLRLGLVSSPSATQFGPYLIVFYAGGSSELLYTTVTVDSSGGDCQPAKKIKTGTIGLNFGPSAAVLNSMLYVFFVDADGQLGYSYVDDIVNTWTTVLFTPGLTMTCRPSAVFGPFAV